MRGRFSLLEYVDLGGTLSGAVIPVYWQLFPLRFNEEDFAHNEKRVDHSK